MDQFKNLSPICETFNQRNRRFGASAGKQCACNSFFTISYSQLNESESGKCRPDLILLSGDKVLLLLAREIAVR